MKMLIKLTYIGWQSSIESKGYFPVNSRRFNENSDMAVAEVAYKWVRDILRQEHISRLIEVTYNGEHDITELVKQKLNGWNNENNDLPF